MMHPSVELRFVNHEIGYGLFATENIPAGTLTWVQDKLDGVFSQSFQLDLNPIEKTYFDRYAYRNQDGKYVLCWDKAKYINHHCAPNTLSTGLHFDITVKNIQKDEELTTDYAQLNLEESFPCSCGAVNCRKTAHSTQAQELSTSWDDQIEKAADFIFTHEQPLWSLVKHPNDVKNQIKNKTIPSTLTTLMPIFIKNP